MKLFRIAISVAWLCVLFAPPAAAQKAMEIAKWHETVELAADNSARVTIDLELANSAPGRIDLPLNFAKPENFSAAAEGFGVTATAAKVGDARVIRLQLDGVPPAAAKLRISFSVRDFFDWKKARSRRGVYGLSYTFTNTATTNIGKYALTVIVPAGYDINGVTSSTPRMTGEEVERPYDFVTEAGHLVVNLRSKSVGPGKTAAIAFGFVKDERNPLLVILIGIIIAGLALYLKRDVLTRTDYVRESAV